MKLAMVDQSIEVKDELTLLPGTWKVLRESEEECDLVGKLLQPGGSIEYGEVTVKKSLLAEIVGQKLSVKELAEYVLLEDYSLMLLNHKPAESCEQVIRYMLAQDPCEFVVRKNSRSVFVAERVKGLAGGSFRLELRK